MPEPLPPTTLAWLRQTAKFEGAVTAQVLLHLLERVEALEAANHFVEMPKMPPTPEAAPAAEPVGEPSDEDLQVLARKLVKIKMDSYGCVYDVLPFARAVLSRWGHPATPPAPEPEPGEVGELVAMLRREAYWNRVEAKAPFFAEQADRLDRAAVLLQQRAAPAPACRRGGRRSREGLPGRPGRLGAGPAPCGC